MGVIKKTLTNNWNPNFRIASFKSVQLNSIDISDGISAKWYNKGPAKTI